MTPTDTTPALPPITDDDRRVIAACLRIMMHAVDEFEKKTGKGGWYAEQMQENSDLIAKRVGLGRYPEFRLPAPQSIAADRAAREQGEGADKPHWWPSDAERYCLSCEKDGHRTDECWSTHGINTPAARELGRLAFLASRPPAVSVPAGMVLVPIKPTALMLTALWNRKDDVGAPVDLADAYAAMLAAAPSPTAEPQQCWLNGGACIEPDYCEKHEAEDRRGGRCARNDTRVAAPQPALEGEREAFERWEGGEGWEQLAWHLCAEENGEEACNELVWEGGPIPQPWGDRWLKYEDEAKRLIALVREHAPAALAARPAEGAQAQWQPIESAPKGTGMTDRELLELAAKAAGHANPLYGELSGDEPVMYVQTIGIWNPLGDDGDALRLAVKLGLHVGPVPKLAGEYGCREARDNEGRIFCSEPSAGDPLDATRRAIVRAAAEIARAAAEGDASHG